MASETLILRPSADDYCQHTPSSGSSCYSMIMDSTADDDATYIYQEITSAYITQSASSAVRLSGDQVSGNITVNGVTLFSRARKSNNGETAHYECTFSLPDGTSLGSTSNSSLSSSYTNITNTGESVISSLNQYASEHHALPTQINCTIESGGRKSSNKDNDGYIRTTQVYVLIEYDITESTHSLYVKENGVWSTYSKAYKKQNGVWVEADIETLFDTHTNYIKG